MNTILAIPLAVRLIAFFLLGVVVAAALNLAVYRLAWTAALDQPLVAPPAGAPPTPLGGSHSDLRLVGPARESALHGRGFWIRPLVVEVAHRLLFAGLYFWEVRMQALYPIFRAGAAAVPALAGGDLPTVIHAQLFAHLVLLSLMLVASLIDLDEKTIPDAITIPGTLGGAGDR